MKISASVTGFNCDGSLLERYAEALSRALPARLELGSGGGAALLVNRPDEETAQIVAQNRFDAGFTVWHKGLKPFLRLAYPIFSDSSVSFSDENGIRIFSETLKTNELSAEKYLRCAFDYATENGLSVESADFATISKTDLFIRRCINEIRADYQNVGYAASLAADAVRRVDAGDDSLILAGKTAAELFLSLYREPCYNFYGGDTPFSLFTISTVNLDSKTEIFMILSAVNEILSYGFNLDGARRKLDAVLSKRFEEDDFFEAVLKDIKNSDF